MLTLTEAAVQKVKEFYAADTSLANKPLRVFVEKGGCSSFQYGFAFDEKRDGDTELPLNGLTLVVDAQSSQVLNGSVIDYKEDFSESGFAITNPNAKNSCGCGKSFEV